MSCKGKRISDRGTQILCCPTDRLNYNAVDLPKTYSTNAAILLSAGKLDKRDCAAAKVRLESLASPNTKNM
jgi:hypothetical protein